MFPAALVIPVPADTAQAYSSASPENLLLVVLRKALREFRLRPVGMLCRYVAVPQVSAYIASQCEHVVLRSTCLPRTRMTTSAPRSSRHMSHTGYPVRNVGNAGGGAEVIVEPQWTPRNVCAVCV